MNRKLRTALHQSLGLLSHYYDLNVRGLVQLALEKLESAETLVYTRDIGNTVADIANEAMFMQVHDTFRLETGAAVIQGQDDLFLLIDSCEENVGIGARRVFIHITELGHLDIHNLIGVEYLVSPDDQYDLSTIDGKETYAIELGGIECENNDMEITVYRASRYLFAPDTNVLIQFDPLELRATYWPRLGYFALVALLEYAHVKQIGLVDLLRIDPW